MAQSPSHKFGQALGKLLEDIVLYDILKPRLQQFAQVSQEEVDRFMETLRNSLERYISEIILIPLFGNRYKFDTVNDAIIGLNTINLDSPVGEFEKFEVLVDYNNGDTIRATFQNQNLLTDFLEKLA
ncbi:hypothetical protein PN488_05685 [Nodularia spumigena CS-591/12]|uniref:hypothetical protein n=1 Tax=Nodularia spumigena TaxID=70799 RepID=UPI00232E6CB8|nr:hypothetical protein [Nodularia spumigena]MDB9303867.1 hypothetical protein [Nodularia spumigena CS-591/12]MDB9349663.1 hypothetical protein [Nodularia spumigena CS-588/01]MDB9350913.1 hypothetical protein [Nodularia spumigena CS-588/05]